nr:TIGR04372 family glycosyltransferase [Acanthopleuribacter pedis]
MLHHNGPFLQLSRAEHAEGRRLLHNLGIPEGAPFFIFHARDAGYLKTADPNTNYSYHRFRDVDINSYKVAINMLLARGYYAVRIGAVVERAMDLSHPNFVDYTQSPHRTPFGDIYLCAACAFMLASSSGIDSVARLFRRPLACTNVVPLGSMREKPLGLFIPKRTYSQPLKRFLTYDEIVNGPSTQYFRAEEYEADGLVCHENSPEEIRALAEELVQRVEGAWETKPEDEALQAQFWKLFSTPPENQNFCRIGADFLRNNPDLLGAPRPSEPPEPLQQHRKSHNDVNFS